MPADARTLSAEKMFFFRQNSQEIIDFPLSRKFLEVCVSFIEDDNWLSLQSVLSLCGDKLRCAKRLTCYVETRSCIVVF